MDNRVITKLTRQVIWPSLKSAGFSVFTARSAWRYWDEGIDLINVQGYGPAYHPDLFVHPTSFSFAINLGVLLDYIPQPYPAGGGIDERAGLRRPADYQCLFRRRLLSDHIHPAYPVAEFWYVDPDGSNAQAMVDNARSVIQRDGLAWLERFHDPHAVLRTLLTEQSSVELFECGALPSPFRSYLTAYAARRTGDAVLAITHLQRVLTSGSMSNVEQQVAHDLALLTCETPPCR
jgi:hypothetical protein